MPSKDVEGSFLFTLGFIVKDGDKGIGRVQDCQIIHDESSYWDNTRWAPLITDGRKRNDIIIRPSVENVLQVRFMFIRYEDFD